MLFKRKRLSFSSARPEVEKTARVGASEVTVGRFSYGYKRIRVRQWGEGAALRIGSFCSIAGDLTVFLGGNHRTDWATTFPFGSIATDQLGGEGITGHPYSNGDVRVGHDVWLGESVTVMSGVSIGHGAVIAAMSTVVRDVGPYEIWGGNPARRISTRFEPEIVADLLDLQWWDLEIDEIRQIAPLLSQPLTASLLVQIRDCLRGGN